MTLETLSWLAPVVLVSAGVSFLLLERIFPYNSGQKAFRIGFWVDLIGYGVVQSYLMGLLIAWLLHSLQNYTGFQKSFLSRWPIGVQLLFFLVTHDFHTYLIHRLQHAVPWLWRTHEAHHSCPNVDWLSGIRSHSLEILMYETVKFLPIVLLGASPEIPLYRAMIDGVYGMFIHSNLKIQLGVFLKIFNGPELHRWHHSSGEEEAYGKNFATKFAIWDHLFGTVYQPSGRIATEYAQDMASFPKGYLAQHFYAFRKEEAPVSGEACVSA